VNDEQYRAGLKALQMIFSDIKQRGTMAALQHRGQIERLAPAVLAEAERREESTNGR
jgi:hypothetical protein